MSHVPDNLDAQLQAIDRLLSGALPEHEAQAERRRLLADPAMAALLLQQERVQSSLARSFAPPPVPPVVPSSPTSPGPIGGGGGAIGAGLLLKWLAVIAMTLSTIVGAYYLLRPTAGPDRLDIASAYRHWLANPGDPTNVTPSAGDMQVMLASKLGRQISIPESAGIKYLGAIALPQDTPLGVGIKMEVGGQQVLVAIDLAPSNEADSTVTTGPIEGEKGVYRHAMTRAGLRLYEVSKSPQPVVILGFAIEKRREK